MPVRLASRSAVEAAFLQGCSGSLIRQNFGRTSDAGRLPQFGQLLVPTLGGLS